MSHEVDTNLLNGLTSTEEGSTFTFMFGSAPSMFFGTPAAELVQADQIEYYKVNREYYWQTGLKDVTIDGHSITQDLCSGEGCTLVFDTGTSVMTLPSQISSTALSLAKSGCDQSELCYIPHEGKTICLNQWYAKSGNDCEPSLYALDVADNKIFILGQPFFDENTVIFDAKQKKIGVAPASSA